MGADEPDEADIVEIGPSQFVETDSIGFGVAFITHRDTVPLVSVIAVDLDTDEESRRDVHPGQPFQVAGQTWQVASFRAPPAAGAQDASGYLDDEWEVVLRRIDGAA
jgi:Family of unknown function (DUF6406)